MGGAGTGGFFSFWQGAPLNPYQHLAIHLAASSGSAPTIYSYDYHRFSRELFFSDAREVLSEQELFLNPNRDTYSGFSNIFRYQHLVDRGGIWFDLDYLILGTFPKKKLLFGWESDSYINGAILGGERGHYLFESLLRSAKSVDPGRFQWGDLGPKLLTKLIISSGLDSFALAQEVLYPFGPTEIWMLFDPASWNEVEARSKGALGVHLWNEVIRLTSPEVYFQKPPDGSFLGDLVDQSDRRLFQDLPKMHPEWPRRVLKRKMESVNHLLPRLRRWLKHGK